MRPGFLAAGDLRPGRPGLVFLHGGGSDARAWRYFLDRLNGTGNALSLDLPGHGSTPGPALCSHAEQAAWLKGALAELGLERFILIGHSMGGSVGLQAAVDFPDWPAGLVMVASGPTFDRAKEILGLLETRGFEAAAGCLIDLALPEAGQERRDEAISYLLSVGEAAFRADIIAGTRHDLRGDLGRVECPVLIVSGGRDRICPPGQAEELARGLPGARLELLPEASHLVHLEEPERLLALIRAFAAEVLD